MCDDGKQALLKSFIEVFSENGIENTSVRDLCKHTHKSTSVVYDMFGSKEEIVCQCGYYITDLIVGELRTHTQKYADNNVLMGEFFFNTFKEHKKEMRFFIAEGNRTISAEKSPFRSKFSLVAWNTCSIPALR